MHTVYIYNKYKIERIPFWELSGKQKKASGGDGFWSGLELAIGKGRAGGKGIPAEGATPAAPAASAAQGMGKVGSKRVGNEEKGTKSINKLSQGEKEP